MHVLLVGPDLEYNLSIGYLASSLKSSGHQAELAAFNDFNDIQNVCDMAEGYNMIGLSLCFQIRLSEYIELAHQLKSRYPEVPIVVGGHFASCAAHKLLMDYKVLDIVVLHEGEHTIVELADLGDDLLEQSDNIPGIVTRKKGEIIQTSVRNSISDLDSLPFPDRNGPTRLMVGVPTTFMMGSRGCYKNCDYCCISTLHKLAPGKKFRQRSIPNIVEEMKFLYQQKGIRQFVFHDDNFLVPSLEQNIKRIDELDAELIKNNIKDIGLVLKCSPSDAHKEVLAKLKKMGLIRLFLGIESGSQEGLNSLGRRQTIEEAKRALEICRELGISAQYTVIIFNADATLKTMQADLELVKEFPNNPINYCRAEVYAGTPLEKRLLDQSRLSGDYKRYKYNYQDPKVQMVWEIAYDLFNGRCWGKEDLLSKMIHLDHQVIALKRFYEGAEIDNIASTFDNFQEEVNIKTKDIFSDLISIVSEYFNTVDLEAKIEDLKLKEYEQRREFERISCDFKAKLDSYTYAIVEFTNQNLKLQPSLWEKSLFPKHAAAVLLALGLSSYGMLSAQNINKQLPDTGKKEIIEKVDTVPIKIEDWRNFDGIAEAAPPPDWYYDKINDPLTLDPDIFIESKNILNVYLNGVYYGTTPLRRSIPAGKYTLRLENKEFNIDKTKIIIVKNEGENKFIFDY